MLVTYVHTQDGKELIKMGKCVWGNVFGGGR